MIQRIVISGTFAVAIMKGFQAMLSSFDVDIGRWLVACFVIFWIVAFRDKETWKAIYKTTKRKAEQ